MLSASFAPKPESGRAARRFVTDWLTTHGASDLVDNAALCTSELAANATLHTRQPFTVTLVATDGGYRVGVVDSLPAHLPVPIPSTGSAASITELATTGRGLRIVSALARRWGVTVSGPIKTVWCEVDHAGPPASPSKPEVDGDASVVETPDAVRLQFLGLPVRTSIASGLDVDEAMRDLQLGPPPETDDDKAYLEEFSVLLDRSASVRLGGRHAALRAAEANEKRFDFELVATDDALIATAELTDFLARRKSPPDRSEPVVPAVAAFRAWLMDEVLRQRGGEPPSPCSLDPDAV